MQNLIRLTSCLLGLQMVQTAHAEPQPGLAIYKDYHVPKPKGDYVLLFARSMGPDKYILVDLNQKEARIYSPYRAEGLLHIHRMTEAEYEESAVLLRSEPVGQIPKHSNKVAFDAFEFSARGLIDGKPLEFQHILPEDKSVLLIYDIYKRFRDAALKNR